MNSQLIAVAQMTSTNNKNENFDSLKALVQRAASRGAQMVFLPEACDYIAESKKESLELAEPISGKTLSSYCQLAGSLRIWLSIGGMHIKEENSDKISNTHFIINNFGDVVDKYAKTHLFNVKVPEYNIDLQESKSVEEGRDIPAPVLTPCGLVGLGICYDMRFPEFSLLHRKGNAQVLTFPSAFTVSTGLAHWHALLKARAIETQCYVIAAAQTGQHNAKRSSYGHALVIDPWGTVLCEVGEGSGIGFAEIDLSYLERVRRGMPVLKHRRKDLYSTHATNVSSKVRLTELLPFSCDYVTYPFGRASLPASCVFLHTSRSHSFVNKKPFTNGHVLVSPKKPISRLRDMNEGEISDFGQAVVLTMQVIMDKYLNLNSQLQVAIQDGESAGRTINHLHAHIMPVTNNEKLVENHEKKDSREWRSVEEMSEEAATLRPLTDNNSWLLSTDIPKPLVLKDPSGRGPFQVNKVSIPNEQIFFFSGQCFAFIPTNQVIPGHVCICPCEQVSSLSDLSPGQVTDMFLSLQKIQKEVEDYLNACSSTIYFLNSQNGKRLCIHLLPRKPNDMKENDDIYTLLFNHQLEAGSEHQSDLLNSLKKMFLASDF